MAPLVTHLVIGERVFGELPELDRSPCAYGAFLLGCVLVDVSFFCMLDRQQTHLVGRLEEDGERAFETSCEHFLQARGTLLRRPWDRLTGEEQAFVAGYLCHLAADERWKAQTWQVMQELRLASITDHPVPGSVILTAFDAQSARGFVDFPRIAEALQAAVIPDVLSHVPFEAFQRMREFVEEHLLDQGTAESWFRVLARRGQPESEIAVNRARHERYWAAAVAFIEDMGGAERYVQDAAARSLQVLPLLWREDVVHPESGISPAQ